jgi:hypothetical protein
VGHAAVNAWADNPPTPQLASSRKNSALYAGLAEFVAPFSLMQRFLSFLLDQNGAAR